MKMAGRVGLGLVQKYSETIFEELVETEQERYRERKKRLVRERTELESERNRSHALFFDPRISEGEYFFRKDEIERNLREIWNDYKIVVTNLYNRLRY